MRFLHFTKTFRRMIPVNCGFVYVYVEQALKEAIQRNTLQTLQINQNTKSKKKIKFM